MKKLLFLFTALTVTVWSCGDRKTKTGDDDGVTAADSTEKVTWNGFVKISPEEIEGNIIQRLDEEWMLITAGGPDAYNTMTASWGGMGILWSKPVAFMAVRNTRYTYEFLRNNDNYTLTFFDGAEKEAMTYLGTHSGRDGDKITPTGLVPMETPLGCMSFEQAALIFECRKLYENKLDPKSIFDDDITADYLRTKEHHVLFVGEIVNVWKKE